ncbi:hypothetical protein B0H16DRAFT_802844 [Mycena metata]|uniref:Uncharacterized protein n=1 Tax=Mycena metata TaxID=1033252 RepID=A0AAD7NWT3_9AGAR|nr:hypothetical protein B0H16DRAFT_802844 [Mycena metata]
MLAKLRANRSSTLARAVYNRDFFAVREQTDGREGVFDFRSNESPVIDPYSQLKEKLPAFKALVFGEIKKVQQTGARTYYIRLGPPKNVACVATNLFRKQIAKLRSIIVEDEITVPGDVVDSWFNVANEDVVLSGKRGSFYVVIRSSNEEEDKVMAELFCVPEVVGKYLLCTVAFERRDHEPTQHAVVKAYEMGVMETTLYESSEIPKVGVDYVCDLRVGSSCRICTKRKVVERSS